MLQDPKYRFANKHDKVDPDGHVINRQSGETIPADEPVMVFRGRDRHAVRMIEFYQGLCADDDHYDAVGARVEDFRSFALRFPDRMKEPDTERSK